VKEKIKDGNIDRGRPPIFIDRREINKMEL
jgi:hypothetical protein